MARRKSGRSGSTDDDEPTYLRRPFEEVAAALDDRMAKGRELLAQIDLHVFPQAGRADQLKGEYQAWHNYNATYLERVFTSKELRTDYEGFFIGGIGARASDLDRIRETAHELERDLNKLMDIKGRLSLYAAPEELPRPTASSQPAQRQQPIHVTFQGQVGQVNLADLMQRVDAEIAQVDRRGEGSLAEALQSLTNAIRGANEAAQDKREDALDGIAVLAEVGAIPPQERGRFRGMVRSAIEVIKDLAAAAPEVKKALDAWGPTIMEHMPRLGS